jgi:hypothetical protein
VRKGSWSAIVNASITSSKLWHHVSVLKLCVNMRLRGPSVDAAQQADIEQFAAWILSIGDGMIPVERKGEEHEPSWITESPLMSPIGGE